MPPSHPFITRSDIATRITNGALLIIYRSRVLHVTSWAPYHPGGALALLHFVGRDATDEIEAYHPASALRRVEKLAVGRVEVDEDEGWRPLTPPIALGLVAHPDGIKGHWAREVPVALGEAMLQRGHSSSAQIPSTSIPNLKKSSSIDIITLHPSQLEPATSSLDPRTERVRSRAYQHLKICIAKAGLFDRPGPLAGYGSDLLRYTLLGGTAFGLFFV